MSVDSLALVDDFNSTIVYSAGWQAVSNGAEVDGTKHGADKAGMTATFEFTGTLVMVVGSLGSVDVYGVPTTSYSIDGTVLANYTAPVIDPGFFQLNVTFFTSPTLTPGKHTLVITNLNGTSPNVYWLDYIRFSPSPDTSPTTSVLSTTSAPSSTTSVQASTTTTSAATQTGGTSSNSKPNAGAIAGGIVGGVALVVIVGLLVWWFRRRRREEHPQPTATDEIRPFAAWRGDGPSHASIQPSPPLAPTPTPGPQNAPAVAAASGSSDPPTQSGSRNMAPVTGSSGTSTSQGSRTASRGVSSSTKSPLARANGSSPALVQQVDSGVRIVEENVLPPPYTQH